MAKDATLSVFGLGGIPIEDIIKIRAQVNITSENHP